MLQAALKLAKNYRFNLNLKEKLLRYSGEKSAWDCVFYIKASKRIAVV